MSWLNTRATLKRSAKLTSERAARVYSGMRNEVEGYGYLTALAMGIGSRTLNSPAAYASCIRWGSRAVSLDWSGHAGVCFAHIVKGRQGKKPPSLFENRLVAPTHPQVCHSQASSHRELIGQEVCPHKPKIGILVEHVVHNLGLVSAEANLEEARQRVSSATQKGTHPRGGGGHGWNWSFFVQSTMCNVPAWERPRERCPCVPGLPTGPASARRGQM